MPRDLKDFPRPAGDNGRGLHGSAVAGWSGGPEGLDYWIDELVAMGIKWFQVVDDRGDSVALCEKLLAAGIFPMVRILRRDPPPNDLPEPNPGHISAGEEQSIQRLIAAGVRYFETNYEPDLENAWKHHAMPGDPIETAKLVALNWLFDARLILEMGGLPGLPAISAGGNMDLMGALVSLGRQDILLEGCWIALHNYCLNRPLAYPDDPVNRTAQLLTPDQYDLGPCKNWVWWNSELGRLDKFDEINNLRISGKNPTLGIAGDHACFREFEYYNGLAIKYLGHSIPIISTLGGLGIGRRQDPRYPRTTPETHRDQTVAMYDFIQRQAPDYYFAATSFLLVPSIGVEMDAWTGTFWTRALQNGSDGRNGIPPMPMPGVSVGDRLPVIDAVKAMANLGRRLPGAQPAPPVQTPARPVVPVRMPSSKPPIVPRPAPVAQNEQEQPVPVQPAADEVPLPPPPSIRPTPPSPVAEPVAVPPPPPQLSPSIIPPEIAELPETESPVETTLETLPLETPLEPPPLEVPPQVAPSLEVEVPTRPTMPAPPVWTAAPVEPIQEQVELSESELKSETDLEFTLGPDVTPEPPAAQELPEAQPEQSLTAREEKKVERPSSPLLSPSLLFSSVPVPLLDWDPRLDALNVKIEPAQVSSGQMYWKLIRGEYQGPGESEGKHHIYYAVQDEKGQPVEYQRVWQGWPEDKTDATTNDQGQANIPLWSSYTPDRGESGQYSAWVDGLPCDHVTGMGLPLKRQVSFLLTWRRVLA